MAGMKAGEAYLELKLGDTTALVRAAAVAGQRAGDAAENGTRQGTSRMAAAAGFMGTAVKSAASGGALALAALGGAAVFQGAKTAAGLETARIGFETLTGSAEKGEAHLQSLISFAKETPFELQGLVAGSRQLHGVGIATEDVIPTLTAFGDASGALGLSQDQFNGILRAYTQIAAAGKVQGDELNQMTENGLPIMQLMQKATGKSAAELREMGEAGKLTADMVLPGLLKQMQKDYGGSMAKQSQTLTGRWSSFKDEINVSMAVALKPLLDMLSSALPAAGRILSGAITGISGAIRGLSGLFRGLGGSTGAASGAFAGLKGSLTALWGGIKQTASAFGSFFQSLMPSIKSFAASFMNVLGPGIKSIVEVVNGQFLPAVRNILPVIAPIARFLITVIGGAVVGALKGAIQFIKGAFQIISGILNVFSGLFTGNWGRMWDGIKQIVSGVWNAIIGAIRVALNVGVLRLFKMAFMGIRALVVGGWAAIRGLFTKGLSGLQSILGKLLNIVTTPYRLAFNGVRRLVTAGWNFVRTRFTAGMAAIRAILSRVVHSLTTPFLQGFARVRNLVSQAWSFIRTRFSAGIAAIRAVLSRLPGVARSAFNSAKSAMTSTASAAWNAVKSAFTGGVSKVMGTIKGLPGKIKGVFGNAKDMLMQVGRDIIGGLLAGIDQMKDAVLNKAGEIANGIKDKIKGALDVFSPSRVMIGIGRNVSEGLAIGMERDAGLVDKASVRLAGAAVPDIKGVTAGGVRSVGSVAPGASGGPLVGSLTLQGADKSVHEQMEDVNFALRRIQRGGVYA